VIAAAAALYAASLVAGCTNGDINSAATTTSGGTGGAPNDCPPCVNDDGCAAGSRCGQLGGDTYCAPDCTQAGQAVCGAGRVCAPVITFDGQQASLCVTQTASCAAPMTSSSSTSTSSSGGETCGSLLGPDVAACCTACKSAGKPCQANGCYGGYWCNKDTCNCQMAPPMPCGGSSSSSSSSSSSTSTSSSGGSIGVNGGTLDTLSFAVVGDTRPPLDDDTAAYPTAVITKIWQDVQTQAPAFAVATGDYQFSKAFGNEAKKQIGIYMQARQAFSGLLFPALGNHECTGATASNCGQGNADGITHNYQAFLDLMLAPVQKTLPYYSIEVDSTTNAWTSKFVFIAANAWDATQSSWLETAMSKSTTYTFVVRHEGSSATQAPGVTPSDAILAKHPYTLLIAGHTHTYYFNNKKQVIVGNGGAPLTGNVNYGYVIGRQLVNGNMQFKEYDYATNAEQDTFTVKP
jgi:hypothetical protein